VLRQQVQNNIDMNNRSNIEGDEAEHSKRFSLHTTKSQCSRPAAVNSVVFW
jgi:hypothetical protein